MQRGQKVRVMEAFSGLQVKRVVGWDAERVYVCREEEYVKAKEENRQPRNIGFRREFVRQDAS